VALAFLSGTAAHGQTVVPPVVTPAPTFTLGADLSLLQEVQDHGVQFKEAGQVKDPLLILKGHGWNYVRLRLFVNPNGEHGQVNSLEYTLKLAARVKAAGFKLLLDLHYSDGWADPGHQTTPAEWKDLPHPLLADQVAIYTWRTLNAFAQAGCLPDVVEVGNEVTNGMLWPDGGPLSGPQVNAKWDNFADLLKVAIKTVRSFSPPGGIRIMIHIDRGEKSATSQWFFDHLKQEGVDFDVIGLSYYPFWNGPMSGLQDNLNFLANRYGKDIYIAETDYDADGGGPKGLAFPATPEGQKDYLAALIKMVQATPGGDGAGVFYWGADWIQGQKWEGPRWSGQWEGRALFDGDGEMRPAVGALDKTGP